ncbi:hypothetical protein Y032_0016g3099 [Ancylostoma ceylanicum]|uniref:Uncharacterized protein n=1 Tax=Ancylostoma ceylanicum TaxID=53326 RepID=A0A016V7U7_9BILA|nr:hypothetical protein Y032_0016g3099 [Ancylostoma ceylanicum]
MQIYRVAVKYGSLFAKTGKGAGKQVPPISCDNTIGSGFLEWLENIGSPARTPSEVMKRFLHLLPSVALIGCTLHVTEFAKCLDFSALTNGNIVGQQKETGHTAPL